MAVKPLIFFGGAKEDRTPDLYNAIVALSQLSYGPDMLLFIRDLERFVIIFLHSCH